MNDANISTMNDKIKSNNNQKYVWILFGVSIVLRFILANYYPKTINCYPDELLYLHSAEGLWNNHQVMLFNMPSTFNKIGYSILLAPVFAIADIKLRGSAIALLQAVVMSLGVFPIYGLAKELLQDEKHHMYCVILYLISPTMTYSMTYMSEVLYVPLALALIYVIYHFLSQEWSGKKLMLGVVIMVLIGLTYLTKPQALVFPVAFILVILIQWIFEGKSWKRWTALGMLLLGGIGAFIIFQRGIMGTTLSSVSDKGWYIIFGVGFFVAITLIAFFFIPVILPALQFEKLNKKSRYFYLFLLFCVLVTAFVVAALIYTTEDFPSRTPRAHVRYVEYLFVPFVMLVLQLLEQKAEVISKTKIFITVFIWGVFVLNFFAGFSGQTIDQTMLFYWQLIADDGKAFDPTRVRICSVLLMLVIMALLLIYRKSREWFKKIFLTLLVLMCLGNTVLSVYVQYKTHTHSEAETTEAEEIVSFVRGHTDSDFLILETENYDELLDTFLVDCPNVRTGMEPIITQDVDRFEEPKDIDFYLVNNMIESPVLGDVVREYPNMGYRLIEKE